MTTDHWLHDIMERRQARRTPDAFTARTIRGKLFLCLARGWMTLDDLACAAWGEPDDWPDYWTDNLRVHLALLQSRVGVRVERQYRYRLRD